MNSGAKINTSYFRAASLVVLLIGVLAFIGSSVYPDFYLQMKSKITGDFINYSALEEFCGWTGLPFPGESAMERGLRAYGNMLSAMLGMTALSLVMFLSVSGIIIGIFKLAGGFHDGDSS